ncbi:pectin methyl esterase [Hymenopellis radicata]|nr:pectin methyl esterase [Hymenopellis radicata]
MKFFAWTLYLATCVAAVSRTSPPSGAIVVKQSGTGSGQYSTISAAVATLSGGETIFVYPGTYTEQVSITVANVTIMCYTENTGTYKSNQVTITNNLNAQDNGGNDACATLRAEKDNFTLYNCNVANSYGKGKQATAVAARGSYQGFYGSSFTGYQDTLFADGGYHGLHLRNAGAWFGECTLASNGGGAITANSRTTADDPKFYVIDSSKIVQAASATSDLTSAVYLGRPWRALARVVFQRSVLPDLINPKGYTTLAADATPIFSEFNNTGDGSDTSQRVTYTPISALISKTTVLGSGWATGQIRRTDRRMYESMIPVNV